MIGSPRKQSAWPTCLATKTGSETSGNESRRMLTGKSPFHQSSVVLDQAGQQPIKFGVIGALEPDSEVRPLPGGQQLELALR